MQEQRRAAWLVSPGQDLMWFQGSVIAGLLLLIAFRALPPLDQHNYGALHPAVWLLLFWGVIFDGSHVMATYARTYFAGDAASKAALPGSSSFAWLLLGPVVAAADYWLCTPHPSLVRQHYGFLSLYRRKEGSAPSPTSPDALMLWIGSAYPFLRFGLSDPYKSSGLPVLLPDAWLAPGADVLKRA